MKNTATLSSIKLSDLQAWDWEHESNLSVMVQNNLYVLEAVLKEG